MTRHREPRGDEPSMTAADLLREVAAADPEGFHNEFAETHTGEALACRWLLRIEGAA